MASNEQKKEKEEASYYSTIPNPVMFHPDLNPHAKLLYGFITSLSKEEGYCKASNKYLANKFHVQKSSISNWVKSLVDTGFITIKLIFAQGEDGKPYIKKRLIYLTQAIVTSKKNKKQVSADEFLGNDNGGGQKSDHPPSRNADESHSYDRGGGQINDQGGQKIDQGVVNFLGGGGQNFRERRIQAENTKAAAADLSSSEIEKPPQKAVAVSHKQPFEDPPDKISLEEIKKLKLHFSRLDSKLLFDDWFYPKALRHMAVHKLDLDFVSWMFEICVKKNPKSFSDYFFTIFFVERYVDLFRESTKKPLAVFIRCPVCGFEHADPLCPQCGLEKSSLGNQREISRRMRLYGMPQDLKKAYESEVDKITGENLLDFKEAKRQLENLDRKYGVEYG